MVKDFDELPSADRREVKQLARQGLLHPDAEIARASVTWANRVLDEESAVGSALALAVDLALGMLGGPGGGVLTGTVIGRRRLARRILAATADKPSR